MLTLPISTVLRLVAYFWVELAAMTACLMVCLYVQVEYPQSGLDSKEFQLALARTRQAMHVHKAVSFMNTANSTRQVHFKHAISPTLAKVPCGNAHCCHG